MSLRDGTLVKRYEPNTSVNSVFPCEDYNADKEYEEDVHHQLDVCIGMVIEAYPDDTELIVEWVRLCSYHDKCGAIRQEGVHVDNLWEVGQLAR